MNYEAIAVWSQLISALLFIVVLVWLWIKYVAPAVLEAQRKKNAELAELERRRDESKAAIALLREELSGAESDAQAIRQRGIEFGTSEKQAALANARESGERTMRNAHGELERARVAARESLRAELLELALVRAREKARRTVNAEIDNAIIGNVLGNLHAEGGTRG